MNLIFHSIMASNSVFLFCLSSITIWTHGLLVMLCVLTLFVLFHTCFISYPKLTACQRRVYSVHSSELENSTIAIAKCSNWLMPSKQCPVLLQNTYLILHWATLKLSPFFLGSFYRRYITYSRGCVTGSLTFGKIIEVDSLAISLVFEGRKAVRKGDGMAYSSSSSNGSCL